MAKVNERQPTTLDRLKDIIETFDEGEVYEWLTWTYNFLSARKLYHKKHSLKAALLQKMATQLLSESELAAIDADAEKQLVGLDGDS